MAPSLPFPSKGGGKQGSGGRSWLLGFERGVLPMSGGEGGKGGGSCAGSEFSVFQNERKKEKNNDSGLGKRKVGCLRKGDTIPLLSEEGLSSSSLQI
jgi:hypothetical protein